LKQTDRELRLKVEQYGAEISQKNQQLQHLEAKLQETQRELQTLKTRFDSLLEEKVNQRALEMQLFHDLSRKIGYNFSYEDLFQSMLEHLHLLVPCDVTGGILIEGQTCNLFLKTDRSLSVTAQAEIQQRLFASIVKVNGLDVTRHLLCVHHLNPDAIASTKPPIEQINSYVLVPIIANPDGEKQIIGLLFVGAQKKEQFTEDDIRRLYALANQASISVQQLQMLLAAKQSRLENEKIRATLEKEKELNNLRSRVIRTISHEYRTPITIISLASELLRSQYLRLSEQQRFSCWQQIQNATQHMANLVEDVLLLNQAEAGEIQVHLAKLDLVAFCRELVEEFQFIANPQQNLEFIYKGEEVRTYLDKTLLRQILSNLLSNALKYSPVDTKVSFELICSLDEAIFHIRDSGIGIPLEDRPRLFESFHRASNISNLPGSGLGLAIAKKCVDLLGGTISFETEVGFGTTFTVRLPLIELENPLSETFFS
jgi:signal transduction histidine kinase